MTRQELESTVIRFMDGLTTMTVVCCLSDLPWAAPVYYARQGFDLVFFSSPSSRHSLVFEENPQAAAAIYGENRKWQEIKGLQMEGRVECVDSALAYAKATVTYLRRYPFVRDLLNISTGISPETAGKMARVKAYIFRPRNIYYLDNSIGFGVRWKLEIRKGESVGSPERA